jgi:hypothetical protein
MVQYQYQEQVERVQLIVFQDVQYFTQEVVEVEYRHLD